MSLTLAAKKLNGAEILTQITGQKVLERHLTPRVMFLSAMTTVLVGVAYADGQLAGREKLYLQKVLSQLASPKSSLGKMISLMLKGIRKHEIYNRLDAISCLTDSLSVSEKLIILGFGHRLAIADGCAEAQERKYLNTVASAIDVPADQVKALLSCLDNKRSEVKQEAVEELRWLLDPQRFQNIDAAIVNAASCLSSKFPAQASPKLRQDNKHQPSYEKLQIFEGFHKQLNSLCDDLLGILKPENGHSIFSTVLEEEVVRLSKRFQSQKFRLAIVGEFSQGKSTFLNALLGEEIQPVRAIPCSGTLTTLKYGEKKRVICHYKDGTQEIIPFDQYKQKASIPEESALGNREDGLAESNISEIVLEHPGLELCRHGVEIIDSPGLNEHPERTAITERLLQDADATIFLANASRVLTLGERELLHSLKRRLQREEPDQPADNLFVLFNFMDLLRKPEDREQVPQLVNNFLQGRNPLITGSNRVHFISAQSALDAMLTQTDSEYHDTFKAFVTALETFLADERGELILRKNIKVLRQFILGTQNGLVQKLNILEGQVNLSKEEQHRILEEIGEIGGLDVKTQLFGGELLDEILERVGDLGDQWVDGIGDRIAEKSARWSSNKEDKRKILKDYEKQFIQDISADLDTWLDKTMNQAMLKPAFEKLDTLIAHELSIVQRTLLLLDDSIGANLNKQFELSLSDLGVNIGFISTLNPEAVDEGSSDWYSWGLGTGSGAMAAGAMAFAGFSIWPVSLAGLAASAFIGWLSSKDPEQIRLELKQETYDKGMEKFFDSVETIFEKLGQSTAEALYSRIDAFHNAASASISILCNLLEQQEKSLQDTLVQKEAETKMIQQKIAKLSEIELALNSLAEAALT